jgi:hypothetical protein
MNQNFYSGKSLIMRLKEAIVETNPINAKPITKNIRKKMNLEIFCLPTQLLIQVQ